jgi:hypothetical protein
MNLNLTQRKLNKREVKFLLWFMSVIEDNPIQNPIETTVFHYDDLEYTVNDFKNLITKLQSINKSYLS